MKKIIFLALCLVSAISALFGADLAQLGYAHKITAKDFINYISTYKNSLYISTNSGEVEIYDLQTRKKKDSIKLPNITDLWGEVSAPRVFNTHTKDGKSLLIVSQDTADKSNLFIYSNDKLRKIDLGEKSGIIKNAFFVNDDEILLSISSFEIIRYNIARSEVVWSLKPKFLEAINEVFTDLRINGDLAISTTEGGSLYLIDLASGEVRRILKGANFDYIYMLGTAKNVALTAGRDKICGVYNLTNGDFKRIKTEFMIYAVAISGDSSRGAVSYNENGDILIFNTQSLAKIALLTGGNAPTSQVIFMDNSNVLAAFGNDSVLFWNLK